MTDLDWIDDRPAGDGPTATSENGDCLLYDGACPFCSTYVGFARRSVSAEMIRLIDAREDGPEVEEVRRAGLDVDEGMVLRLGERYYHGADALDVLTRMGAGRGPFNRLRATLFKSSGRARTTYRVLRAGRNLALRVLGRPPLGN